MKQVTDPAILEQLGAKPVSDPETIKQLESKPNAFQKIAGAITGEGQLPPESEGLPEFDLPFEFKARQAKTAIGLLTTFDPVRQVQVLKSNYPDLKFMKDSKGNVIVDGTAYGGNVGLLNAPGISARDLMQAGFQMAAFTPAARIAGTVGNIAGRVGTMTAASGLTQAAQDITSQAVGGEEDVSLKNIDKGDVALAALFGGAGEAVFSGLSRLVPMFRKQIEQGGITPSVRRAFQQAAIKAGKNPDEVTDDIIRAFVDQAEDARKPGQQIARTEGEREFGIHLTKGQRSGDQAQLALEDRLRAGGPGRDKAQRIMLDFESQQAKETAEAARRIQSRLGGQPIERQQQAGALLREGVKEAERAADEVVGTAYDQVGRAELTGEGFVNLLESMKESIRGHEWIKSPTLAPASAELSKRINRSLRYLKKKKGVRVKSQDLRLIEQHRREIRAYIDAAANASDRRTLGQLKRAFDQYMDDAVENSLLNGDQEAIEVLKRARSLSAEYFKKFTAQQTRTRSGRIQDQAGKFIENLIDGNPTDEQVVNAIFGAGDAFGNTAGANFARRVKDIVKPGSDQWNAIRQAAFMRLVKFMPDGRTISGQKTITALNKAMGRNESLMREVFTKEEINLLRRFAMHVKRTQPEIVKQRGNPSGTAAQLVAATGDYLRKLTQMFGFATGDPLLIVTSKGLETGSGWRAAAKARHAVRTEPRIVRPDAPAAALPAIAVSQGQNP